MTGTTVKPRDLRERTKQFAYQIIRLSQSLPHSREAEVIGRQLLRLGTTVAANYRAAGRARSRAEFVSKLGIVLEEADESVFWLECLSDNKIVVPDRLSELIIEANELVSIFASSRRTAKSNR